MTMNEIWQKLCEWWGNWFSHHASPAPGLEKEQGEDSARNDEGMAEEAPETELPESEVDEPDVPRAMPPNQPGRRGLGATRRKRSTPKEKRTKEPKPDEPELICREEQGGWCLFVKCPASDSDNIQQGSVKLSGKKAEYQLKSFSDAVTREKNAEKEELFDLSPPLIFKFSKNWQGNGKRVRLVNKSGHYIVIAPLGWTRIAQRPSNEEEPCKDAQFRAHFFPAEGEDGFKECDSFLSDRFSMVGNQLDDDSEKGDLFVGSAPELNDLQGWRDISWVRIGSEGSRWAENFKPREKTLADYIKDRAGWFYVRIFPDKSDAERLKMMDGFDFRFSSCLKSILVNDVEYDSKVPIIPSDKGHMPARICFVDADGSRISEVSHANRHVVRVKNDTFEIAPRFDGDFTRWVIDGVEICIELPRVWWRFDTEEKWRDKPLQMTRENFRAKRKDKIEIILPMSMRKVRVGFDDGRKRDIFAHRSDVKNRKKAIIFVGDFRDYVADPSPEQTEFRIECAPDKKFALIRILGDRPSPKPEPHVSEPLASHKPERVLPTPRSQLIPLVRSSVRCRPGRGFSEGEVAEAGMSVAEARCAGIRVDSRRRRKHCVNIKKLQSRG